MQSPSPQHDWPPAEGIKARPWPHQEPPRRILVIRLQAFGDVAITLPYLKALRRQLPHCQIDFLTRREFAELGQLEPLFQRVFCLRGGRSVVWQKWHAVLLGLRLRKNDYQVVLDLQRNGISNWLRQWLAPRAWSSFDRFAPRWAGLRYREAILASGIVRELSPLWLEPSRRHLAAASPAAPLVALNPAGYFPTRNWPLERYVELAGALRARFHPDCRFLLLGLPRLAEKARFLQQALGQGVLNLVGQTAVQEAAAWLAHCQLVISEDSGLAHLAWAMGIPLVLLLGSSRKDWSAPIGPQVRVFASDDLPCGQCLQPGCRYGDVHCLTRIRPEDVLRVALGLLKQVPEAPGREEVS